MRSRRETALRKKTIHEEPETKQESTLKEGKGNNTQVKRIRAGQDNQKEAGKEHKEEVESRTRHAGKGLKKIKQETRNSKS